MTPKKSNLKKSSIFNPTQELLCEKTDFVFRKYYSAIDPSKTLDIAIRMVILNEEDQKVLEE